MATMRAACSRPTIAVAASDIEARLDLLARQVADTQQQIVDPVRGL